MWTVQKSEIIGNDAVITLVNDDEKATEDVLTWGRNANESDKELIIRVSAAVGEALRIRNPEPVKPIAMELVIPKE